MALRRTVVSYEVSFEDEVEGDAERVKLRRRDGRNGLPPLQPRRLPPSQGCFFVPPRSV